MNALGDARLAQALADHLAQSAGRLGPVGAGVAVAPLGTDGGQVLVELTWDGPLGEQFREIRTLTWSGPDAALAKPAEPEAEESDDDRRSREGYDNYLRELDSPAARETVRADPVRHEVTAHGDAEPQFIDGAAPELDGTIADHLEVDVLRAPRMSHGWHPGFGAAPEGAVASGQGFLGEMTAVCGDVRFGAYAFGTAWSTPEVGTAWEVHLRSHQEFRDGRDWLAEILIDRGAMRLKSGGSPTVRGSIGWVAYDQQDRVVVQVVGSGVTPWLETSPATAAR